MVSFFEKVAYIFLKTIIPNRKNTSFFKIIKEIQKSKKDLTPLLTPLVTQVLNIELKNHFLTHCFRIRSHFLSR
jgi:hypothetical protein